MSMRMKTILVVDDEEMNLKMVEYILQQEGYDVVKAISGMSCLDYLKFNKPDLILLDVEMPVMSGIQTLEVLRASEEYKSLPVMFLTASADTDTVTAAGRLGVLSYVKKPFMPQDLVERVQKILRY
ncbi:MAG: response regulator [Lachnospiraceae bacterium]|nr:response regulator [Lachnospiraceae bacterium]